MSLINENQIRKEIRKIVLEELKKLDDKLYKIEVRIHKINEQIGSDRMIIR